MQLLLHAWDTCSCCKNRPMMTYCQSDDLRQNSMKCLLKHKVLLQKCIDHIVCNMWTIFVRASMCSYWGEDKMASIFLTTVSNTLYWLKPVVYESKFHWSLSSMVQLTIIQHRFRQWLGTAHVASHYLNQCWPTRLTPRDAFKPKLTHERIAKWSTRAEYGFSWNISYTFAFWLKFYWSLLRRIKLTKI